MHLKRVYRACLRGIVPEYFPISASIIKSGASVLYWLWHLLQIDLQYLLRRNYMRNI